MPIVGRLVAELAASTAQFQTDLTRAASAAENSAQRIDRSMGLVSTAVKAAVGAFSIGAIVDWAKQTVEGAERVKNFADETGSSVEQISRLNNIVRVSGGNFDQLKGAVEKMSVGLAGVDGGGSRAAKALRFLGVEAKEPVAALEEVAKKLDKFGDGPSKIALVKDIFGSADFVNSLQAIAKASDQAATLTTQQAEEATKLAESMRELSANSTMLSNALLSDLVPALNGIVERFRIARKEGEGLFSSFVHSTQSIEYIVPTITDAGNAVDTLRKKLAYLQNAPQFSSSMVPQKVMDELKGAEKQLGILIGMRDQWIMGKVSSLGYTGDSRDQKAQNSAASISKPQLGYVPGESADRASARVKTSDADRYVESLKQQLTSTLDLTAAERVLLEVQDGRLKEASRAQIERAFAIAQEIDGAKQLKEIQEQDKKNAAEALGERERYLQINRQSIEGARQEAVAIQSANEALTESIIRVRDGDRALVDYIATKREKIAVEKEELAATYAAAGASDELVAAYRAQAAALREQATLNRRLRIAEGIKQERDAIERLQSSAFDALSGPVENFIINGGKASDVLKQWEANLMRIITSEAFRGIKDFALGTNSGPNLFDLIPKLFGLFGGAGGGASGAVALTSAGTTLTVAGTSLTTAATLLSTAAATLAASAAGDAAGDIASIAGAFIGGGFANGTNSVAASGIYRVGERGPESIYIPKGAGVVPNHYGGGGGTSVNINVDTRGQPMDARSRRQLADDIGRAVADANSRRGGR